MVRKRGSNGGTFPVDYFRKHNFREASLRALRGETAWKDTKLSGGTQIKEADR